MHPSRGRKRPAESQDPVDGQRPSPHRPNDSGLAQQNRYYAQAQGSPTPKHRVVSSRQRPNDISTSIDGSAIEPQSAPAPHAEARLLQESSSTMPGASAAVASPRPSATPQPPLSKDSSIPESQQDAQQQKQSSETPQPAPYLYELLTDDTINDWTGSGKASVVSSTVQYLDGNDHINASGALQEILKSGLDGRIPAQEAGETVKEVLAAASPQAIDGSTLFLDTLSTLQEYDPTHENLKPLVLATDISAHLMREILDDPILQTLGLIRSTFSRVFIRKQTNVLYRQSNYNLLREETEGYSKLMTELFTTVMSGDLSGNIVQQTLENTNALIGAFDLDAGRVLDVTLDIFASLLVKQFRFFVKYLRASSFWPQNRAEDDLQLALPHFDSLPVWAEPGHLEWVTTDQDRERLSLLRTDRDVAFWARAREIGTDAFFELGGRRVLNSEQLDEHAKDSNQPEDSRLRETREWIRETKTTPPRGSQVAAQLLGFKLRFYASKARDASDVLPDNLIYLSALLIKIGFISLRDLYTHLYPDDDSMGSVKQKKETELQERERSRRGGGATNALTKAGALSDDTLPQPVSRLRATDKGTSTPSRSDGAAETSAATADEADALPEPVDQKIELLKSLLCIGALPEALYLLGRFPWLYDLIPELPRHFHRILHHCLSKVCGHLSPLQQRHSIRDAATAPADDQAGVAKGNVRLALLKPRKVLRWAKIDTNDVDGTADYRFYWDDWADNVPVCQDVDDVFTLCDTLLNFSGVKIGQDAALLSKLARLGKQSLAEDPSPANEARWISLARRLLCPALSMTKANPGVSNDLYELLRLFPTHVRYSIYSEWFQGPTSRNPDVAGAFAVTRKETSNLVKRMSKTNVKQMAQALAKITHSSPGVVFDYVLKSIESYDNLIEVVVECGRYFTFMAYDVLTWAILVALGGSGRDRVGSTGYEATKWLVALSAFTGKIFKRYAPMQTGPVLQFLLEQLRKENFIDLRVLRELITNMAGIVPDTDFSDAQVQAMAGGLLLQAQTLQQIHDKRHESLRSAKRLTKSFVDGGLVGPFLVSIALTRQLCVEKPKQTYLKIISENYDDVHIAFVQYLDLLYTNLGTDEFESLVPGIVPLLADHGIEPSIAFSVHRKGISRAMSEYDALHSSDAKDKKDAASENKVNGDVDMADADKPDADNSTAKEPPEDGDLAKMEGDETVDTSATEAAALPTDSPAEPARPWHPVLEDLMERLRPVLGQSFEAKLSLTFFTSFWQLSIQDIMAPTSSYDEESKRLRDKIAVIDRERSASASTQKQREAEKKALNDVLTALPNEMKNHVVNYQKVRRRLIKEKSYWFRDYRNFKSLNATLLQECFLPRALLSPLDAFYAQKMLWFLHSSGAPGFTTMHFIEALLSKNTLTNLVFQCTSREAENLGRFVNEILRPLTAWHADKATYEKNAYGPKRDLPGFATRLAEGKPTNFVDYVSFRKLLYKWHQNINNTLDTCLKVRGEYMHMKNAINFLKQISQHFPKINWMGEKLEKRAEAIAEDEEPESEDRSAKGLGRNDIWVAATSLRGTLGRLKKDLVMVQSFRDGADDTPADLKTNGADAAKKALNAAAKDFRPQPSKATPLQVPSAATGNLRTGKDVEDGELADSPNVAKPESQQDILKQKALASVEARKLGREDSGRPSTSDSPAPPSSSTPSEAATSRTTAPLRPNERSGRNTPNARPPHALPERPEPLTQRGRPGVASGPPMRSSMLNEDRPDNRNRYGLEAGRLDRPRDLMEGRPDRRELSPGRLGGANERPTNQGFEAYREKDQARTFDRNDRLHPDELGRNGGRDARTSPREPLQKHGYANERPARYDDRPPRLEAAGRPDYSRDARDKGPPRGDLAGVDPGRAAQIAGGDVGQGAHGDYRQASASYPATRSRPNSPGRAPSSMPPRPDGFRDSRFGTARAPSYESRRETVPDYPPNGPREVRSSHSNYNEDSRAGPMGPPRDTRYAPDFPTQDQRRPPRQVQDVNYGRLNAEPSMPPSPTGGRGQRPSQSNFGPPVASERWSNDGSSSHAAPSVRPPMSGPRASDRFQSQRPGQPGGLGDVRSNSTTPGPQQGAAMSGVHPDRLAQVPASAPSFGDSPGRSNQFSSGAPLGPRAVQSQTPTVTPTGPASSGVLDRRWQSTDGRRPPPHPSVAPQQVPPAGQYDRSRDDIGASIRGRANAGPGLPHGGDGRLAPQDGLDRGNYNDRRRMERDDRGLPGPIEDYRTRRSDGVPEKTGREMGQRRDLMEDMPGVGARDRPHREREVRERRTDGYDSSGRERRDRRLDDGRGGVPRGGDERRVSGRKREWEGGDASSMHSGADKRPRRGM